jgi:hypothetical protein
VKKIPTVFKRDPDDMKHVVPEVNPGCEWVVQGEGTATRKYDGTCVGIGVMREGWPTEIGVRREVKPGRQPPPGFVIVQHDETTGKVVGWEPLQQSGFAKYIEEALTLGFPPTGTYELCGPKVNGNPEGFRQHVLVRHGDAPLGDVPLDYDGLKRYLLGQPHEGVVWHHPDGRMAKLKRRDFA